jgi:hypothetical protein
MKTETQNPFDSHFLAEIERLTAQNKELLAALEDAEFLLRKAGQFPGPMQDSFKRSAEDARQAIAKAKGEGEL